MINKIIEKIKEIQNVILKSKRQDIEVILTIGMPMEMLNIIAIKRKLVDKSKPITSVGADIDKELQYIVYLDKDNALMKLSEIKIEIMSLYK